MKYLFLLLQFFVTIVVKSQDIHIKKIDSLLDKTWEYHTTAKLLPAIETGMQALHLAKENKYDKGTAEGYFMVADALINIGLYKEALSHLEAMESLKYYKNKVIFQSEAHRLRGRAYIKMQLYDLAIKEFDLQKKLLPELDEKTRKMSQLYIYGNLSDAFKFMGKTDSLEKYSFLSLDLLNTLTEKESYFNRSQVLVDLANVSLQKSELEKAQSYLDQSLELVRKFKIPIYFNTLIYYANLEAKKKNFFKAIDYYNQALVNTEKVGDKDALRDQYKKLSEFYREHNLGHDKAHAYLLKYNHLNDSLGNKNQQVMDVVLSQMLKSKDQENDGKIIRYIVVLVCCGLLFLFLIIYFGWKIKSNRYLLVQKESALNQQESILSQQESANKELFENNKELSEQIEENKFSNLIALAKSNNPAFLILFSELYPEFIASLRDLDPMIRSAELEFCAMAFLNFSTKNIAEYTFVTIRAVQVRKNRLRKKFNIASDEDFNSWMREKNKDGDLTEYRV